MIAQITSVQQQTQIILQAAFAVFERMLERRVDPDAVTMNLLIEAAGNGGRLDKVEELYGQMQVLGPRPTSHTFVHLFSAFKRGREKNPDWIFQVGDEVELNGMHVWCMLKTGHWPAA